MTIQQVLLGGKWAPLFNTVWNPSDKAAGVTLSGGDLDASISVSDLAIAAVRGTRSKSAGKWYWEIKINSATSPVANTDAQAYIGVATAAVNLTTLSSIDATPHRVDTAAPDLPRWGVALDMDAGEISFYRDNVFISKITGLTGAYFPLVATKGARSPSSPHVITSTANFGATAFTYTPPAGFGALY